MISELHQKLLNGYANGDSSIPSGVTNNGVGSSLLELKENEQLLINENKLLEASQILSHPIHSNIQV